MKISIVLNTSEAETAWNAFRLGVTALMRGHRVKVFLLGGAVDIEEVGDETFDVATQIDRFAQIGGEIFACGTCLKIRGKDSMNTCPTSSMQDLLEIVEESDRVLTFS